jgi:hypothetical protein
MMNAIAAQSNTDLPEHGDISTSLDLAELLSE